MSVCLSVCLSVYLSIICLFFPSTYLSSVFLYIFLSYIFFLSLTFYILLQDRSIKRFSGKPYLFTRSVTFERQFGNAYITYIHSYAQELKYIFYINSSSIHTFNTFLFTHIQVHFLKYIQVQTYQMKIVRNFYTCT